MSANRKKVFWKAFGCVNTKSWSKYTTMDVSVALSIACSNQQRHKETKIKQTDKQTWMQNFSIYKNWQTDLLCMQAQLLTSHQIKMKFKIQNCWTPGRNRQNDSNLSILTSCHFWLNLLNVMHTTHIC